MKDIFKSILGHHRELGKMLNISRPQSWRYWAGRTELTAEREHYIASILMEKKKQEKEEALKQFDEDLKALEKIVSKSFQ